MFKITTASICLILLCCKQPDQPTSSLNFKDSIIQGYFKNIDSAEFHDTINPDYKILRAYFNNDTPFFKMLQREIEYKKNIEGEHIFLIHVYS